MSEHDPGRQQPGHESRDQPAGAPPPGQQPPAQPPSAQQGPPPPPPPGPQPDQPYGQQPPYAQPAPQGAPSGIGMPADLTSRFLARLLDFIIVGIVLGIITGIITAISLSAAITTGSSVSPSFLAWAIISIINAAIMLFYFALMESNKGQSLGKMILKIKTVGPGGANPSLNEALKRNLWTAAPVLGIIPLLGQFLAGVISLVAMIAIAVTINNNTATRQGWHDNFAGGTNVIKIG